jgi:TrmH family RNA methyltransferase
VFVVEGSLNVMAALDAGAPVETVYVGPDADGVMVDTVRQRAVAVVEVENGVIERVSDTVAPQPMLATVGFVDRPLADLERADFLVVCAGVRDPGNVGTVLRSAEAAGANGVICTDGSVDVYNPKTVRASAGSIFRVPIVVGGEAVGVVSQLRDWGITTIAAAAHGGADPGATDLRRRIALVFGNESAGIPSEVDPIVDESVTIPLQGHAESLNVGMAAAVLSFEVARQRRAGELAP